MVHHELLHSILWVLYWDVFAIRYLGQHAECEILSVDPLGKFVEFDVLPVAAPAAAVEIHRLSRHCHW